MPKTKGADAIQKAQEVRWRLLVRDQRFLKDLNRLNTIFYRTGNVSDKQRERVASKWGIPSIPWEAIMNLPPDELNDPRRISRTDFLEQVVFRWGPGAYGVSYFPLPIHRVEKNRFVFLMADLDHPLEDLVELFKSELQQIRGGPPPSRKRLDKTDDNIKCFDLAQKDLTLRQIAKEVYSHKWPELPQQVEEVPLEFTSEEIGKRAKELRQKGVCAYRWSFKQAREDLKEEKIKRRNLQNKVRRTNLSNRLRRRAALCQKVWRHIQTVHRLIKDLTPSPT